MCLFPKYLAVLTAFFKNKIGRFRFQTLHGQFQNRSQLKQKKELPALLGKYLLADMSGSKPFVRRHTGGIFLARCHSRHVESSQFHSFILLQPVIGKPVSPLLFPLTPMQIGVPLGFSDGARLAFFLLSVYSRC